MTKVVGVTAEHQQNLMDSQVVRCRIVGSDLVTDLGDGTVITIGNVQGAQGATGPTGDVGDKGLTGPREIRAPWGQQVPTGRGCSWSVV